MKFDKFKTHSKIFLLVVLSIVFSYGATPVCCQEAATAALPVNDNYRIGSGDIIDIVVSKNETLSRLGVRVNNEGMIQLPMIDGDVKAACLTEKELAAQIKEKYKKYLLNPYVIVAVKEFNSTPVTVLGAVNTPTRFQMQRPMRLLEVLTLGNGPRNDAGQTVQIIRNPVELGCRQQAVVSDNTYDQLASYNLAETLRADEGANPLVNAGDIIRVVEADKVGQAYIVGNVKAAKTIELKEPVTLTQAIAMAGGTSDGAQLEKIKISRKISGSLNKKEVIVNLKEINKRNEGDILLEPNDIIDVPGPSGSKKFLRDIYKGVLPSLTRVPVF